MRKYMREIYRRRAEKKGLKPSKAVAEAWNRYQIRKAGKLARKLNQARGSHKRPRIAP